MIRRAILVAALGLTTATVPPPPAFANASDDASQICRREVRARGADGFEHVTTASLSVHDYRVEGWAQRRGYREQYFTCRVHKGRFDSMTSLKWEPSGQRPAQGGGSDVSLGGALIGAVIGAVVVGALSDDHDHDKKKNRASASTSKTVVERNVVRNSAGVRKHVEKIKTHTGSGKR